MRLVVGLGNPGEKFKKTRHNVGFLVVDALASRVDGVQWSVVRKFNCSLFTVHQSLLLAKPTTFMNSSGEAVQKLVNFYHISPNDLWVVHDDLDIKLGQYKIQNGKGPKVHNGLLSIYDRLGTSNLWHVRVGIENRGDLKTRGEEYVLQEFSKEEGVVLGETVKKIAVELPARLLNTQPE